MPLKKIFNSLSFLVQAILVIVAVLIFSYFDPLGWLAPTKLKLKDTPISVVSIQEIGQLITAEYYGEVISSFKEEIELEKNEKLDIIYDEVEEMHMGFRQVIEDIIEDIQDGNVKGRNKIFNLFTISYINEFNSYGNYNAYIFYLSKKYYNPSQNFKDRWITNRLNERQFKSFISDLSREKQDRLEVLFDDNTLNDLKNYFAKKYENETKKEIKKSQLVMLGRGWVKAGYDFGKFTENNFRYNKDLKIIQFIGLNPEILSATINPWFIPEKNVEGFEFLIVERKARHNEEVLKKVKQSCLDKLIRNAHEREILNQATINARENLKHFFGLLLDEEINDVIFYQNEFEFIWNEIKKDNVIVGEELIMIDNLMKKSDSIISKYNLAAETGLQYIDSFKTIPVVFLDTTSVINPFLSMTYMVAVDGIVETESFDKEVMRNYFNKIISHSVDSAWYPGINNIERDSIIKKDFEDALSLIFQFADEIQTSDTTVTKESNLNEYNALKNNQLHEFIFQ